MEGNYFSKWLVLCFFVLVSAYSQASTKNSMQEVLNQYLKLIPFMYANTEHNDKEIEKQLSLLEKALEQADHTRMVKRANFAPSMEIVQDSLKDIQRIHKKGNEDYAKYRAKKLMGVCISCHSQLPNKSFGKISTENENIEKYVKSFHDKAMVAYFLRDYKVAIEFFQQDLKEKLNEKDESSVDSTLLGIVKISIINLNDEKNLKSYLTGLVESKQLPKGISSDVESWIMSLEKATPWKEKEAYSESEIKKIIKNHLIPFEDELLTYTLYKNAIDIYRIKALLAHFAVQKPTTILMPEILYWTGLIEGQKSSLYLYSLGELYLKECVERFPKSSIAPKCYKAYEELMILGYTGSAGTHLPKDIQEQLKKMKSLIPRN